MFPLFFETDSYFDFTISRLSLSYHLRRPGPLPRAGVLLMLPTNHHVSRTLLSAYTRVPVCPIFVSILLAQGRHRCRPHTSVTHSYVLFLFHPFTDFPSLRHAPFHTDLLQYYTYTPIPLPTAPNLYCSPFTLPRTLPPLHICSHHLCIAPTPCSHYIGIPCAHTLLLQHIRFAVLTAYDTPRPSDQYKTGLSNVVLVISIRVSASIPLFLHQLHYIHVHFFVHLPMLLPRRVKLLSVYIHHTVHPKVLQRTLPFSSKPSCAASPSCPHLYNSSLLVTLFHVLRHVHVQRCITAPQIRISKETQGQINGGATTHRQAY